MVEDSPNMNVESAANTQRRDGIKAVSACYCLELGIKDVFEAFGGNHDVLRLLTRKLKLKADVEALGAPPSPGVHLAAPPSPLTRRNNEEECRQQLERPDRAARTKRSVNCLVKMCIPPQRWAQCVRRMKHVTFAPGEAIVTAGQLGTSMYFVDAGRCRYIGEDRSVLELNDGEFFGESAFVTTLGIMAEAEGSLTIDEARTARRKGTVLAVTTCSCLELSVKMVFEAFDGDRSLLRSALAFMDPSDSRSSRAETPTAAGAARDAHLSPARHSQSASDLSRVDVMDDNVQGMSDSGANGGHAAASSVFGSQQLVHASLGSAPSRRSMTVRDLQNHRNSRSFVDRTSRERVDELEQGAAGLQSEGSSRSTLMSTVDAGTALVGTPVQDSFLRRYVRENMKYPVFDSMSDHARMQCFKKMQPLDFEADQIVMAADGSRELGHPIFIIESGRVRATLPDGSLFEEMECGDFFGEMELPVVARRLLRNNDKGSPPTPVAQMSSEAAGDFDNLWTFTAVTSGTLWQLKIEDFVLAIQEDWMRNNECVSFLFQKMEDRRVRTLRLSPAYEDDEDYIFDEEDSPSDDDNVAAVCGRVHVMIPGKLRFVLMEDEAQTKELILERRDLFFFSTTFHEEYEPLCQDYGPVNLSCIHHFCLELKEKFNDSRLRQRDLCYYAEADRLRRTNAAFLLGCFCVLIEGWTPDDAARKLTEMGGAGLFPAFRDATHFPSTFDLTMLDCYRGLLAGMAQGWFDVYSFPAAQYEAYSDPSIFDMHMISPQFLAFRGPNCNDERFPNASVYRDEFLKLGVTGVMRLNEPDCYDKAVFEDVGIKHYDLYFDDCTMPPVETTKRFLDIVKEHQGLLAIHCLAGLGRTGTLICVWFMQNLGWSAREAIAWCRLCRPGSVIGMQQHYLELYETQLKNSDGQLVDPSDLPLSNGSRGGNNDGEGPGDEAARMAQQVAAGMRRRATSRPAVTAAEMRRHVPNAGENTLNRRSSLLDEDLNGQEEVEDAKQEHSEEADVAPVESSAREGGQRLNPLGVWDDQEWGNEWESDNIAMII